MKIASFALERYFAQYEFTARDLLSCSDCEALGLGALLELADSETAALWRDLNLGYTESQGHPLLRHTIAALYSGLTDQDILVAAPEECIFLFMNAVLERGDHVVCTAPGYQSLYELARAIGCQLSLWTPVELDDRWHFDVSDLPGLLRPDTKLVVVNFPHNPTGALPSSQEYQEILDLVAARGIALFSDEMYRFLEHGGNTTLPAAAELDGQACSLFGMSKSFGLPGLRIGWLASRDRDLLRRAAELKDYTTICASAPSEILALIGLRNMDGILASHRRRLQRNLAVLARFHDRCGDWLEPRVPAAGSVCFPRVCGPMGSSELCGRLVSEEGIMVAPATIFDFGDRHVRIGYGRDSLPAALERLAVVLETWA